MNEAAPALTIGITGGTGYVGAHTVSALLSAGHRLRLLVHPADDLAALAALGIDLNRLDVIRGDVRDEQAVQALLHGCDAVLHAAGVVGTGEEREHLMHQVNVEATRYVLEHAAVRGLDPIVHVASYSALFPSPDPVIGPDSPTADGRSAYGRTKAAADRHARRLQQQGAPVVVTYPSAVVGPAAGPARGITADGWQLVLRFRTCLGFDGAMAMIDVRDVAAVHTAVMRQGLGPRRYICGGQLVEFDQLLDALSEALGKPIHRARVGPRTVLRLGRASDAIARLLKRPSPFSYEAAWLLTTRTPTDDSRTLSELGLSWRPPLHGVRQAVSQQLHGKGHAA